MQKKYFLITSLLHSDSTGTAPNTKMSRISIKLEKIKEQPKVISSTVIDQRRIYLFNIVFLFLSVSFILWVILYAQYIFKTSNSNTLRFISNM